jgi:hypothetical protein
MKTEGVQRPEFSAGRFANNSAAARLALLWAKSRALIVYILVTLSCIFRLTFYLQTLWLLISPQLRSNRFPTPPKRRGNLATEVFRRRWKEIPRYATRRRALFPKPAYLKKCEKTSFRVLTNL